VCREKNKSPRRMFYRSSRGKASFRVALLENAREGFFLRRPRSAFFPVVVSARGGSFLSNDDSRE
jgi:hypothetical protein